MRFGCLSVYPKKSTKHLTTSYVQLYLSENSDILEIAAETSLFPALGTVTPSIVDLMSSMKTQYWFQRGQKRVDNGKCCVLDSEDGGAGDCLTVAYLGTRTPYLESCASSKIDIVL